MTTQTLPAPSTPVEPTRPVRPGFGFLRWLGWVFGWLWSFAIGAVFCLTPVTGLIVLGWLGRWMRGRVLRGLYLASPRRDELSLEAACAELGERVPGRPRWILREPTEPRPATLRSRLTGLVGSLGDNLWMGLRLAVGTWLLYGWACVLLFVGWEYGWEISFNKVYERSTVGVSTTLLGMILACVLLPYVLLAQVHVAVTGQLRSILDHRLIRRMIRVSLLPLLGVALLLLLFGTVFAGLKSLGRLGLGSQLGSEPTAQEIRTLHAQLEAFFFWSCVGLMAVLLLLKGLAARIYRGALVKLLRRGEIQGDDLPTPLARWVPALQVATPPLPVSRGWMRFLGRGILRAALFLALFVFLFRGHVGVFLTYDPDLSSSFLNQPLVQVPWFNFTPENLEELARTASERP